MGVGGQHHSPAALPSAMGPSTPCRGGWVVTTAGLDGWGKPRFQWYSITGQQSRAYRVTILTNAKVTQRVFCFQGK
jgi:hypothetical protein